MDFMIFILKHLAILYPFSVKTPGFHCNSYSVQMCVWYQINIIDLAFVWPYWFPGAFTTLHLRLEKKFTLNSWSCRWERHDYRRSLPTLSICRSCLVCVYLSVCESVGVCLCVLMCNCLSVFDCVCNCMFDYLCAYVCVLMLVCELCVYLCLCMLVNCVCLCVSMLVYACELCVFVCRNLVW